ncbi:probable G-protein coupled receptor 75 [Dreissena polymorpha]|nr:probable G-protein coupled receptor 75 [Dreissena polymorpha]
MGKIILYKLTKVSDLKSSNFIEYDMMEYMETENVTVSHNTVITMTSDCIHTATLAVCTVLVIFVLFLGCAGNGIVLFNALTTKRHRHASDLLVINLAGADFIMCTCLSPMFLFLLFSTSEIPKVFCASILFLGVTSGLLSLLSLVSVAMHRKCRVAGLLRKSMSLSKISVVVGIIWIISVTVAVAGTLHVTLLWKDETINECTNVINGGKSGSFVLYYLSPVTIVGLLLICVCYGSIASAARGHQNYGQLGMAPRAGGCHSNTNCVNRKIDNQQFCADKCSSPSPDSSTDNGNKALIMCFVVTLTVSLCWGPLIMSQFVQIFTGETIILYQVKLCGIALIFLNSALNPYLYGQNNCKTKHRYIKWLYACARCEYSLPIKHKLKQNLDHELEQCPLKGSPPNQDDTVSGPISGPSCNSCSDCRVTDALHARQYLTNIRYAQLLMTSFRDSFAVKTAPVENV